MIAASPYPNLFTDNRHRPMGEASLQHRPAKLCAARVNDHLSRMAVSAGRRPRLPEIERRPRSRAQRGTRLLVTIGALHALVALLRLDRQGGDRARLEPADADWLVGFLAIPESAAIEP